MKRSITLLLLISVALLVNAQKQANYWYFGENAGISFALGPPAPLTNGALSTGEGCSSISTAEGALLFYTDGQFVYNKNHQLMPNGSGLNGHSSSTQSGIIVPKPGSSTEFYIFTVDAADNNLADGLCYTKVDMSLQGGMGDVVTTEKNISLVPLACEKVTAVGHADGYTFWVITKKWGNADYYAYRITADGVNTEPVISTTGPPLTGNMGQASKGYLKVSPDGKKIAAAHNTKFSVDISNFDNITGQVTHLVTDDTYNNPGGWDPGGPYGVEFSPNSTKLYVSEWKDGRRIQQYDLSSNDPQTIISSRVVVAQTGQNAGNFGALQLGPDNRLYIARNGEEFLSRINQPNVLGTGCEYYNSAVTLSNRNCRYGLPPFIQSFFHLSADFYWDEPACHGKEINFFVSASDDPDSVRWTFPGGVQSTLLNPVYTFATPGFYPVKLVVYLYGQSKTVNRFMKVGESPIFTLSNDTTICASEAFYVDAGAGFSSYFWQNDSTTQTVYTDSTGWYWCRITNEDGCPATDSMYITVNPNPVISAGVDQTIAEGLTATLDGSVTGTGDYSYQWEPAEKVVSPNVLKPVTVPLIFTTEFILTVTDNTTGCISTDTVLINVTGGPLGVLASASPKRICRGEYAQLEAMGFGGTGEYTYLWSSSPAGFSSPLQTPTVQPAVTTTYNVLINDGENTNYAMVTVTVDQLPEPDAGDNKTITWGTNTTLEGGVSSGTGPYTWHWEPAAKLVNAAIQNPQTVNLYETTTFTLEVTDLGTGCENESADNVTITIGGNELAVTPVASSNEVCKGVTVQLFANASGGTGNYTYSWTSTPPGFVSSLPEPFATPNVNTTYRISIYDGYNPKSGSVDVLVKPLPAIDLRPLSDPKIQVINDSTVNACVFDTVRLDAGNAGSTYFWEHGSVERIVYASTSGIIFDSQEYTVTVTNPQTGCVGKDHVIVNFTFSNCSYGIEDGQDEPGMGVTLFPNPTDDGRVLVRSAGIFGKIELQLFNVQGMMLVNQTFIQEPGNGNFEENLVLSHLKPGIYFLKLVNNDQNRVQKLIIR